MRLLRVFMTHDVDWGTITMGFTRFAQNDLARLSYELTASTGGPEAPTVVLLHATLGERSSLSPLREELSDRFQVVQPDARGHGGSSALTDRSFTVTDMANDLYAVLEALNLTGESAQPVHLVGHGQGAIAALELARRRPDLVASLVLMEPDAVALLDGELDEEIAQARADARSSAREAADAAYKELSDKALRVYLDRRWGSGWESRLAKPRLAALRRHAPALSPSLDALDRYQLLPEELAEVSVPTLIIVAATSPVAERAIAQRLAATIPGASQRVVTTLPGGAPLTGSGEVAIAVIAEWLDKAASS
ncbi:MAG: alpha/beta hydrolase [Thermomicrobiales bacterium]